jgi:hypothetical protein
MIVGMTITDIIMKIVEKLEAGVSPGWICIKGV